MLESDKCYGQKEKGDQSMRNWVSSEGSAGQGRSIEKMGVEEMGKLACRVECSKQSQHLKHRPR